jgi:hypothetical protein
LVKYKQIQTYTRFVNEENFQQIFNKYRRLCIQLGLSTDEIKRWESGITWSVDEFGLVKFPSIPFSHEMNLELDNISLDVSISIIIWKDYIDLSLFDEPWVELLLMVKLIEPTTSEFDGKCEKVFFKIMSMFSEVFQETGVFVTNEMQDGEAFLGFVSNREEKYWEFDCAIIPSHHHQLYKNVPEDVNKYTVPHGIGFKRGTISSKK